MAFAPRHQSVPSAQEQYAPSTRVSPGLERGTSTDRTLQPMRQLEIPGSETVYSVQFSPDSRTIYCLADGKSIDLWKAGLDKWPQVVGGALGLVVLLYALVLRRVLKRPQARGEPYCRKCNYNVVSQAVTEESNVLVPYRFSPGVLCPECGIDLSRKVPRRGKPAARRLWFPSCALALCTVAYAWMLLGGFPLPSTQHRPYIWSAWIDGLAERHRIGWLLKHQTRTARIMMVDVKSGTVTGPLRSFISAWMNPTMRISPDGRFLAVPEITNKLRWVSTRTGRVVATTTGGEFRAFQEAGIVVGFDGPGDDPWVYFAGAEPAGNTCKLHRWRPSTGEQVVVFEEPAYVMTYSNGVKAPVVPCYELLHRPGGLALLSAPSSVQAYAEKTYALRVRDFNGRSLGEIRPPQPIVSSPLLLTPDGATIYLVERPFMVGGWDLVRGESLGQLRLEPPELPLDKAAISSDGRYLFFAVFPADILVRDVMSRKWCARLKVPAGMIAPELIPSPDGRVVVAVPFSEVATYRYQHHLLFYDVSGMSPIEPDAK